MRDKYVALLLVCHVVVACVKAETLEEKHTGCYNYCHEACIYPASFCKWWCHGRCRNPTLCDSLVEDNEVKHYPVPTEEDYNNYLLNPPPSSAKNEMNTQLEAEDEPNHDL
ncbi:hypothetical protein PHAVU_007G059900 [Phaseolus vulgaris]|uniref:Uncharacterized protein n=1 Tax=Phaseolus vulgaris TaxID=3885 RepID=V7BCJ0_PHAVU|nr:hypothetical protein PHAVU_007G059900g [Phaseolus vulgaris]ESW15285.1 hypothetical protein PHAVU_007G059900g [Phaseolus vulgaris]